MLKTKRNKFQHSILNWIKFKKENRFPNYRVFPWRIYKNPYKILITEILLQKTNSNQVSKIWLKFFKKYPTIKSLSNSKTEGLKSFLNPLGLQNEKSDRIKNIAGMICKNNGGIVPNERDLLLELKGVGDYIANAVLCFSFNKKYEIVDTNIIRIYERIFGVKSEKKRARLDKKIWEFAKFMLPDKYYRLYNFALLDFGAQICKARNPDCNICFFNKYCQYFLKSE